MILAYLGALGEACVPKALDETSDSNG